MFTVNINMKKSLFITIGITLIIVIIAIWAYLFIFGKPENPDDIFANFGLGGRDNIPGLTPDTTIDTNDTSLDGSSQKLKQLTTRPVGGAGFSEDGIRYMEKGTGHIYEIDLSTGNETLLRGTTIPQSAEAVFAKDASAVAITTYEGGGNKTIVQRLTQGNSSSSVGISLPEGAREIAFSSATNTLFYALKEASGSAGYSYNILTSKGSQLFKTALRDIEVIWGDPIYLYTTPTSEQEGYIYRLNGNELGYVTNGGRGLMGIAFEDIVATTIVGDEEPVSILQTSEDSFTIPLPLIPEKCISKTTADAFFYCTAPFTLDVNDFPDSWYKGTVSFSDALWKVDTRSTQVLFISDFLKESGREIDVSNIGMNDSGTLIYFINKNDNTLWMFDTTL